MKCQTLFGLMEAPINHPQHFIFFRSKLTKIMKKIKKNLITTFVLFVFIGLRSASAQTPITHTGDVFVANQAEVDALRTSLTAGATRIVGNVTIGRKSGKSDISDLSPLANITEITGNVVVRRNPDLPNLMGLNQLQSIGSNFVVSWNGSLTSLGDFPALQTIGGSFYMRNNASLISLGAFPILASIGIANGIYIPSIDGRQDGVSIVVEDNDRLQDCCMLTEFLSSAANAVSGQTFIGDNAPGCNSTTQVNCDPFLQVGQKIVFATKTATEGTLKIFSRRYWQLSKPNTGAEWITNIAAGGGNSDASSITGENHAFITITTTANPNDAGRSTTLTLRAIDQTGNALTDPAPITIPFTQLGTTHTGSIILKSQSSVNALVLPANVTAIQGDLIIGRSSDITDLRPLSGITHVTGRVVVQANSKLVSLGSLSNLQSIGGSFVVGGYGSGDDNASLTSLGDFTALQSIGGSFVVSSEALTSLGDFTALQSIGGSFVVYYNEALTSLRDFTALQSIGGSFEAEENEVLTSLGDFTALQSIGGRFVVSSNDALTPLGDFTALQSIGGSFEVEENDVLGSLGNFTTLQSIGGSFEVEENDVLGSLGNFTTLQSIGGSFGVYYNEALTSLGDFTALQTISGRFEVEDNEALASLGNFTALQSIGGSFGVSYNALTSLGGFPMLASIGSNQDGVSIFVEGNELLQDCCVLTVFLSGATNAVSGKVIINNNGTGCSSSTTEVNCDPFLQVGQKVVFAAKTVAEGKLDLFSTLRWQLSKPNTGAEWITNIATDGDNSDASSIAGENHAFITITTAANPNDEGRSTTLTLRAIDQAGNVLTDPASVTIPFTQLGTTHTGDITLESQSSVNAFPANVTAIQGNLIIGNSNDITDLRSLSGITHVTGLVGVWGNDRLVSLNPLGNLQSIGGDFSVGGNDSLPSLGNFPTLQFIGGRFGVGNNDALASLGDFTTLQSIGGSFEVKKNVALISLEGFPMLASIGGDFVVGRYRASNASLTSLGDFTSLQFIGGSFEVIRNDALTSLRNFTALQSIGGWFSVSYNDALTSLGNFTALQSIGGIFEVEDNEALASLGRFPMLASIGSANGVSVSSTDSKQDGVSILVEGNDRLQDCCVLTAFLSGATNAVSGQVFIGDNAPGCNSTTQVNCDPFLQVGQKVVFATAKTTGSRLDIFSRQHWQLSKPNTGAEWITNIAADGGNSDASSITGENHAFITITTTANPNDAGRSTTLTLRAIDQAGNALTDPAPITIPFTQLGITHTGDVFVATQAEVDALRRPLTAGTTRIVGNVTIGPALRTEMSDITDLSPFAAITAITGNVVVQRNPDLPNLIGLNQLESIGGSFEVGGIYYETGNAALTSLGDFSTLQSIGGNFSVGGNDALTSLGDFSALQSIGDSFEVSGNVALTSLGDFPALQTISSRFTVKNTDALTSLGNFPALQTISDRFEVNRNDALTSLGNFIALQSIGDRFRVSNNDALTSMGDFSVLQTISGSFEVNRNDALTSLGNFLALQTISDRFVVKNNAALTSLGDFPALQTISGRFEVKNNDSLTSFGKLSKWR